MLGLWRLSLQCFLTLGYIYSGFGFCRFHCAIKVSNFNFELCKTDVCRFEKNKNQLYMGYLENTIAYLHTLGTERQLYFLRYYECQENNYQHFCVLVVLQLKSVNTCWIISSLCCVFLLQTKY